MRETFFPKKTNKVFCANMKMNKSVESIGVNVGGVHKEQSLRACTQHNRILGGCWSWVPERTHTNQPNFASLLERKHSQEKIRRFRKPQPWASNHVKTRASDPAEGLEWTQSPKKKPRITEGNPKPFVWFFVSIQGFSSGTRVREIGNPKELCIWTSNSQRPDPHLSHMCPQCTDQELVPQKSLRVNTLRTPANLNPMHVLEKRGNFVHCLCPTLPIAHEGDLLLFPRPLQQEKRGPFVVDSHCRNSWDAQSGRSRITHIFLGCNGPALTGSWCWWVGVGANCELSCTCDVKFRPLQVFFRGSAWVVGRLFIPSGCLCLVPKDGVLAHEARVDSTAPVPGVWYGF